MKLILVNSLANGGAEKVAVTIANAFKEEGEDIRIICLEHNDFNLQENIPVFFLGNLSSQANFLLKFFSLPLQAIRLKRYLKQHPSPIVLSHTSRANYVNILANLLGSRHQSVITNHNLFSLYNHTGINGWLNRRLMKWLYPKSNAMISISRFMQQEYIDKTGGAKNNLLIYNPHSLPAIRNMAKEAPRDSIDAEYYFVFCGRFIDIKRVPDIIAGFRLFSKDFPEYKLILIGDGPEMESVKDAVQAASLQNKVVFTGQIKNPYPWISHATALILASEKEGLPNVIIEAFALGVPVIAADCDSGPRELLAPDTDFTKRICHNIEPAQSGYLYPVGNPEALAAAMKALTLHPDIRTRLSGNALLRAEEFDLPVIFNLYRQLYESK